ncbi:membrane protein YpdK [Dickeya undicola]|uniref:membrane protein YpdK n=1 Tax=Dickeya undicola TaxID=1577887 RepID=UPI003F27DCE3
MAPMAGRTAQNRLFLNGETHNRNHYWRDTAGEKSVKYLFMGVSFILFLWVGTFLLMLE